MLRSVRATMMRGGTSRGLLFLASDLPDDQGARSEILLSAMGSPDARQIDGMGGATPLTSKVCIVSPSTQEDTDVDYLFAQVSVDQAVVDWGPTCGNMLSAVGPFAIESGLVPAEDGETAVRIRQVNTSGWVRARIQTPGGVVNYDGDARIDGVPGTAAPVYLGFSRVEGSKTSGLFPTGKRMETIDGVDVSLVDAAMPCMILRAADVGATAYETPAELDAKRELFARLEAMRMEAGRRMGLGDVTKSVTPKIILVAPPRDGGSICGRYLMPHDTHAGFAVTGSICMSACLVADGTVTDALVPAPGADIGIEHPAGQIDVRFDAEEVNGELKVHSAELLRTTRLLFRGDLFLRSYNTVTQGAAKGGSLAA
jgi:4-oxalomesaconate tautomerase